MRSARRGAYRIIYEIIEPTQLVIVHRIDHRVNVYRPRRSPLLEGSPWLLDRLDGHDLDQPVEGLEIIRVAGVERKTGRARCRRDEQIDGSRSSGLSTGPDDSRIDAEQLAWRWLLDASDQSHEYAARLRHRCRMSGRDATCSAECCS